MIAWLLALACVISMLPINTMHASANTPEQGAVGESAGKITFVYYADIEQFSSEPKIVEVTDSTNVAEVGGEVKWSYGMMFLEPADGYTVKEVYYGSDTGVEFNKEGTLSVGTGADISQIYAELNIGMPQSVADKLAASTATPAVYLPREDYDKIKYKQIRAVLTNGTQDVTYQINVKTDVFSHENDANWRINVEMGDTFNLYEASAGLKEEIDNKGWNASDFKVLSLGPTGSGERDALEKKDDLGTYEVVKHGVTYAAFLQNTKNGLEYHLFIMFVINGPLSVEKITHSDNLDMSTWVFETGNLVFSVNGGKTTAKEMWVEMELPSGASIDWSTATVGIDDFKLYEGSEPISYPYNVTYTAQTSYYDGDEVKFEDVPIDITITEEDLADGGVKYRVTFKSDYNTQVMKLLFVAKDNAAKEYPYSFAFDPGAVAYYGNNGQGDYHLPANKEINIFDWMTFNSGIGSDEATCKQELLDGINDGKYIFGMRGVEILRDEDGKFQGNVKFTHPGWLISASVYDTETRYNIINAGMPFCYHRSAVMELGSSMNLEDIFNGHWDMSYTVELLGENGFTYNNDTHVLTAPSALVNGVSTQKIYIKINGETYGEIWVFLSEKGKTDEVMTEQINEAEEDQSFMVDASEKEEATISADVLNALKGNANKIDVSIKCESNTKSEVIWKFNNKELSAIAEKALKLDVAIGDDAGDKQIDQIMEENKADGLKISFADNGKLPGKTHVKLGLSADALKKFGDKTKDLILYYWDKTKGKIEKEQEALEILVDAKGKKYVEVPMTHNSDFVLSATEMEYEKKTTVANAPAATMNVENSVTKVSEITLPTDWKWLDADKDKALIAGSVTKATAVYNGSDKDDYIESALSVEISITRAASENENPGSGNSGSGNSGGGSSSGGGSGSGSSGGGSSSGGSSGGGGFGGGGSVAPTAKPTIKPTEAPIVKPTEAPIVKPTEAPTVKPTEAPTVKPTEVPVVKPTEPPTSAPTAKPQNNTLKVGTKAAVNGVTYKVTGKSSVSYAKVGSKLKGKVVIADSVKIKGKTYKITSIAAKAFRNNKKITNVVIGTNVTEIGKQAFYGCNSLKKITIKSTKLTEKKIGDKAFKGINKKAVIKVPKFILKKYKKILKEKGIDAKAKIES